MIEPRSGLEEGFIALFPKCQNGQDRGVVELGGDALVQERFNFLDGKFLF